MSAEKQKALGDARKILIRSANWVGDAVMSLPAIASVRSTFPESEICVLAKPWVAELFTECPGIDRLILYQSPGIHEGVRGRWRLARELRKAGFDVALHLPNSFDSALLSFLARIPKRAGYRTDGRGILLTHGIPVDGRVKKGHQVEYYLHLLRSLGFQAPPGIPSLKPSPMHRNEGDRVLQGVPGFESGAWVGMSPGAQYGSAKEWFPERFGALAQRIFKEWGARVLLLGGKADQRTASQACENAGEAAVDLTGRTTLAQAVGIISRCRLFVTNDSGLMHVASALGVRLVAIFGSTDPSRTGPLSTNSRVIYRGVSCAPCLKPRCPEDRRCMAEITVDEVFEEVKKAWQ